MSSLAAFLAPVLLSLGPSVPIPEDHAALTRDEGIVVAPGAKPGWIMFEAVHSVPTQHQVRIEQRVIIRVVPRSIAARRGMSSFVETPRQHTRLVERKAGDCVPAAAIGAVQPAPDNRLMLFMRDRRLFSAKLERSCRARDFYSGFYVERHKDGMICVDRDKLQSRTGSQCEVETLRQMVPASD